MLLNGKRILVTGASKDSDIGFSICKRLAENGASLVLTARRPESLTATINAITKGDHMIAPFDLTKLDDILGWFKGLVADAGPFDGIVHSASHQGYTPLKSIRSSQINQYFEINFSAALMLIAAFSKNKHYQPLASAVLIGSAAGSKGLKARALYAASKAALNSATKTCALELADKGIRVNCVAPAVVSGEKADKQMAMLGTQQAEQLVKSHPLGLSSPDDVANSVVFLLSDLSQNITGSTIAVDGGFLAG